MPGYNPPNTSFWLLHARKIPFNCSGIVSGIKRTLPTIYVHCCIPSPFLTKSLEFFNSLGQPAVKPKENDFK
jgi:hypothetical protein